VTHRGGPEVLFKTYLRRDEILVVVVFVDDNDDDDELQSDVRSGGAIW